MTRHDTHDAPRRPGGRRQGREGRSDDRGRGQARGGFAAERGAAARVDDSFTCGHCGRHVGPLPSGGRNRNHCPYCLYSRHVDAERPGDRASACQGMMEPVGVFERPNGEEVIVHRCQRCGYERFNRVGADDDEAAVAALPRVAPRSARPDGEQSPPADTR